VKHIRGLLAVALAVLFIPVGALALEYDDFMPFPDAVSCAIYMAEQYERGEDTFYLSFPEGTSMAQQAQDVFQYLRMLMAEYYTLMHSDVPGKPLLCLTISLEGREPLREQAKEKARQVVSEIIQDTMTPREKIKVLHDYVVLNCVYDTKGARNKDYAPDNLFTAYGMLVEGKAVCDGYSAAFALLCHAAGIPCIQVFSPEMNVEGHSWNAVLLDGQVLYVDTTFDDPDWVELDDDFFLINEDVLRREGHTWEAHYVDSLLTTLWDDSFRAAYDLSLLGLFRGSDKGFELNRAPSRAEASVMLLRLMGLESEAVAMGPELVCPFTDVNAFYAPYIAYLYACGLTQGTSGTTFSPDSTMNLQQYLTFVLRAIGYDDAVGDFDWRTAPQSAVDYGILTAEEGNALAGEPFNRGSMAYASYRALFAQLKTGERLIDHLAELGQINVHMLAEIAN